MPQYYVRNSHPGIVSEEVYELVQFEIEARKNMASGTVARGCLPVASSAAIAGSSMVPRSGIPQTDIGGPYGAATGNMKTVFRRIRDAPHRM